MLPVLMRCCAVPESMRESGAHMLGLSPPFSAAAAAAAEPLAALPNDMPFMSFTSFRVPISWMPSSCARLRRK